MWLRLDHHQRRLDPLGLDQLRMGIGLGQSVPRRASLAGDAVGVAPEEELLHVVILPAHWLMA